MKKILPCVGAALMLLISITVNAEPPINAIKMIHSTNFGIDRSELEVIKSRMQAAVDDGKLG